MNFRTGICAALLAATVATFWPVGSLPFISYDDHVYVTGNGWVQQGLTLQGAAWAIRAREACNWHPVTWLSHMLDVSLLGNGPAGPHWINLLLHGCNVILVFIILDEMTGNRWPSVFAAALFALHPLHVESVAWVSERKDVLSAFFGLLSLWSFSRYAVAKSRPPSTTLEAGPSTSSKVRDPGFFYGAALFFFALGLMSKPMLVTLPFLLVLFDYWPLRRLEDLSPFNHSFWRLAFEKAPFFILSGISCTITWAVQSSGGAMGSFTNFPVWSRLANAFVSYCRYLQKLMWPTDLALPYPHPGRWPQVVAVLCLVFLLGLSIAAWTNRKRLPFAAIGWFWFVGMLVPVIGLVQVGKQAMADRYMYLPSIGVFVAVAWTADAARRYWRLPLAGTVTAAVLILAALALRTRNQLGYWRDSETIFRHTLALSPNNYSALVNLGASLFAQGRLDEALEVYQKAMQIQPDESGAAALNGLGTVFASKEDDVRAAHYYEAALQAKPDFSDAHGNLGVILRRQGDIEGALREYRAALRLNPANAEAHNNLANVLVQQENIKEAVKHYRLAVKYAPQYTLALDNLGWALAQQGRYAEAVACCKRAVEIKPDDVELRASFGDLLLRMGRNEEAKTQFAKAVKLAPDSSEAHLGFGKALARTGQPELAVVQFKEVLRLKPEHEEAKKELAALGKADAP